MAYPCEQEDVIPMSCAGGAAIPHDILLDIFMRLPARSIGRCRCLSRAWAAALAPSDDFTDRHFRAANRRPSLFVLPVPSAGVTEVHAWSPDQPRGTTLMAFPRRPMRNTGTRPCRGLVVMEEEDPPARAGDGAVYYVCNPSTGQMTALPEGPPLPPQPSGYNLGIGYDEVSGRFKVVRVFHDNEYLYADCDVYVVDDAICWRPAAGDAELPEEAGHYQNKANLCFIK
ncbi:hypothetical protein ZWY2020_023855 [Hordeum vulgare]|nr:hypothetical protein ZWY2020_023855 [Hordeum vulgare]